jgi:hypothetical protein
VLDRSQDIKQRNYSREDESARRLWLTQRLKANPWEGRAPREEEDEGDNEGERRQGRRDGQDQPQATFIEQEDELSLERGSDTPPPDPFGRLMDSLSLGKKPHTESKF